MPATQTHIQHTLKGGLFPALILDLSLYHLYLPPSLVNFHDFKLRSMLNSYVMGTKTTLYFYPSALKYQPQIKTLTNSFLFNLIHFKSVLSLCGTIPERHLQGLLGTGCISVDVLIDLASSFYPSFPSFTNHTSQGEWEHTLRNRTLPFGKGFSWQRNIELWLIRLTEAWERVSRLRKIFAIKHQSQKVDTTGL